MKRQSTKEIIMYQRTKKIGILDEEKNKFQTFFFLKSSSKKEKKKTKKKEKKTKRRKERNDCEISLWGVWNSVDQ